MSDLLQKYSKQYPQAIGCTQYTQKIGDKTELVETFPCSNPSEDCPKIPSGPGTFEIIPRNENRLIFPKGNMSVRNADSGSGLAVALIGIAVVSLAKVGLEKLYRWWRGENEQPRHENLERDANSEGEENGQRNLSAE